MSSSSRIVKTSVMFIVVLTQDNLKALKHALAKRLVGFKSSHLHEALARALGFRTYNAAIAHTQSLIASEVRQFNLGEFTCRLIELGYADTLTQISADLLPSLEIPILPATLERERVVWRDGTAILLRLDKD